MEKMNLSIDQISEVVNAFVTFTMNFEYKWYEKCFDGWEISHFGSKWEMWADETTPECAFCTCGVPWTIYIVLNSLRT